MPPRRLVPDHPTRRCNARLEHDINRSAEELAPAMLLPAAILFYLGLSAAADVFLLFNPSCHADADRRSRVVAYGSNSNMRFVYCRHYRGPKFKSKLSVPPLKAANLAPFGFLRLHKP